VARPGKFVLPETQVQSEGALWHLVPNDAGTYVDQEYLAHERYVHKGRYSGRPQAGL
jgi:hypothetical protein